MADELKTFPPEYINKLLETPGKSANTAKRNLIRQMNRTRRNTVIHEEDLQKAIKVIDDMIKTKSFDLGQYQQKILEGTPEEAIEAKHELRVLAILLRDLLSGSASKYRKLVRTTPLLNKVIKELKRGAPSLTPPFVLTISLYVVLFGGLASTGLVFGLAGAALATGVGTLGREEYRRYKLIASEKTLLLLILKVLEEGKDQPIHEQIFTMTNRNTGLTSTAKGPVEMELNPMFSGNAMRAIVGPNPRRKTRKALQSRRRR